MSLRLEGIVLRKKILRDSDLALSVFSKSAGRLWLVSEKALKKPRAELDLFCRNEFIISQLQDFALIYQTASLDLFAKIRLNHALVTEAANAVKVIEQITSNLQPNSDLYELFAAYLQALAQPLAGRQRDNIRLNWYQDILQVEGIYNGQPVTEKSFWRQIAAYRG